jgi:hypothetical protein
MEGIWIFAGPVNLFGLVHVRHEIQTLLVDSNFLEIRRKGCRCPVKVVEISQLDSHILHLQSQVDVLTREVRAG